MDLTIDLDTVTNNLAGAANLNAIPNGFNAQVGTIDLSSAQDFTTGKGKIVLNAHHFMDLRQTLRYRLAIVVGDDPADDTHNSQVTADHHNEFSRQFIDVIARFKIYCVLHCAGIPFACRAVDAVAQPVNADHRDLYLTTLYENYLASESAKIAVAGHSVLVAQSFFCVSGHRIQNGGHSWLTAEAARPNSTTGKLLSMGGKDRHELKEYMEEFGHDGNHHLPDETLKRYCDAISHRVPASTGIELPDVARYVAAERAAGRAVPGVVRTPLQYMGVPDYQDYVANIIRPGKAAVERWPVSALGASALIVGLNYIQAMINDIAMTLLVTGSDAIVSQISHILSKLTAAEGTPENYEEVERALAPAISMAYGYSDSANLLEDNGYMAFRSHAGRLPAQVAIGRALAGAVRGANPHEEAVSGAVVNALAQIGALTNVAALIDSGDGNYGNDEVIDTDTIEAEVGDSDQTRMLQLIQAAAGAATNDGNA